MQTDCTLRPAHVDDAEALAHILVTANEAAFRGHVPDRCLTFTEPESAANWRRTLVAGLPQGDFLVVLEPDDGAPFGYAWGGPHDDPEYRGELRQIALLPSAHGSGLGRRLVCHIAQRLSQQDIWSMRVEVLRANPHRQFYEHLGARLISEHPHEWEGVVLPMCVYGWPNTRTLLGEADK